ncbi:MAG: glycosyltransferase [Balneola sp.]
MKSHSTDISIVIVNYNVKEYIFNLIHSIEKAKGELDIEIFIVDNASTDGSRELIPSRFPEVNYIYNEENVGFGKANNQAIKKAKGEYTLLINPDTIVSEDTLIKMHEYMKVNSEVAAAGCKILNPDGTFAPESRRSVPTIRSAASKVLGLSSLFPKSKIFSEYYLGWLDEDELAYVPVLSGSFMFFRTKILKELDGFDERFFMYGEDIDLCYRAGKSGYKIGYFPGTSIIHYKGESTKKGDLKYVKLFNKANYQFFQKHYTSRYSLLFKGLIYIAISFRGVTSFIFSKSKQIRLASFDIMILNISLISAFIIRFSFTQDLHQKLNSLQSLEYLWVNVLLTGLYIIFSIGFNSHRRIDSIADSLRKMFLSFTGVVLITFFARNLAFSRTVLAISFLLSAILITLFRIYRTNKAKQVKSSSGKFKKTKLVIIGSQEAAQNLIDKINIRADWDYEIVGFVSNEINDNYDKINALGEISQLKDIVRGYNIDHIYFIQSEISYKVMLEQISELKNENLLFKIVPESMDYILGKSEVEYIDSVPVVLFELPYQQSLNKMIKRSFDIVMSFFPTIIFFVLSIPSLISSGQKKKIKNSISYVTPVSQSKNVNRFLLFKQVLFGSLSMVGSPTASRYEPIYKYRKGITGLVQLNSQRIKSSKDQERFELNYLQNYSIWLDIDILAKSLFSGYSLLQGFEDLEE